MREERLCNAGRQTTLGEVEVAASRSNKDAPTRKPFSNLTQSTSPDITFSNPDLSLNIEWKTSSELSSEHLPIIIKIQIDNTIQPKPTHTLLNYKKANWMSFTEGIETSLQNFNTNDYRIIDAAIAKFNEATRADVTTRPEIFEPSPRSLLQK